MKDSKLDAVNAALSVDRVYLPAHDPVEILPPHKSHNMRGIGAGGWGFCLDCGTRAHWPGVARYCLKDREDSGEVEPPEAWNAILMDLDRFFRWWEDRADCPETLPTVDEWAANFFEWRRKQ